jgi:hypothetical protein
MGRTISSFTIGLAMEEAERKPFRNALDKSDRKKFDDVWDIPRLYITACSNSVQLVPLHPIVISILFYHYRQLKECMTQVEQIKEEEQPKEVADEYIINTETPDRYFITNKNKAIVIVACLRLTMLSYA